MEPLEHKYVKHSPDGFSWGYAGSGPSDLALNMLADALGNAATCDLCFGSGRSDCSFDVNPDDGSTTRRACPFCEGTGLSPAVLRNYQAFKFAYVANLTDEWAITRSEIVLWCAQKEADRVRDDILRMAELPTPLSL